MSALPWNVPPSKKAKVYVVSDNEEILGILSIAGFSLQHWDMQVKWRFRKDKARIADDAVSAVTSQAAIYMPFAELVDLDKEIERLEKEEEKLAKELSRVYRNAE